MKRLAWWKTAIAVVGLGAIGLGALAVVYLLPLWQTRSLRQGVEDYRNASPKPAGNDLASVQALAALEKAQLDTENALRTSLIQAVGGTVLLVGLYFTYQNLRATQRNVEIAEDKQVTERFGKAVEMLSSDSMHTRLGGIYALERIARDSDDDYWQVMEVLTAFVREESPWTPKQATGEGGVEAKVPKSVGAPSPVKVSEVAAVEGGEGEASQSAEPPPELFERERWQERRAFLATLPCLRTDIQAVITVLGRRKHRYGTGQWETQRLDLHQTDLAFLQSYRTNLTGVILRDAHLEGANLFETDLEGAILLRTHLDRAGLEGANLKGAMLRESHLENAELQGAHFETAYLEGANLKGAMLRESHLEGAILEQSHLEGAVLWSTDLSQVKGLTQAQLDSAWTDDRTILPPGLKRPWETPTSTPSTPPPPDPPAALSTATAEPSSQPTPAPSAESKETET